MSVIHMLQGEMVNRIETHINQSTDYVEKAKDNTARAIKFQNKARKKKIWIAICLAILLLILGISLAVTFGT
uniref:t-SNARE coiled-coil homology domain-containing protein n=1 Tax=Cynoglossus semilaevis TaxID=244447 RepID=A0A3P8WAQ1_CYNSE